MSENKKDAEHFTEPTFSEIVMIKEMLKVYGVVIPLPPDKIKILQELQQSAEANS